MSTTVFISHSTKDDLFADQLTTKLAIHGINTWLDHANIKPGSNWIKSIQSAIEESDCSICILSNDYMNSDNCTSEREALRKLGKRIYPVRYMKKGGIPWDLESVQYVDLTFDFDEGFGKLMQAIKNDCTIGETDKSGKYSGRFMSFEDEPIAKIRMIFKIKIEQFKKIFDKFISKLCKILGITENEFRVDAMRSGSTIIEISIYRRLGRFLIELVRSEPELFQEYELEKIEFVEGSLQPSGALLKSLGTPRKTQSLLGNVLTSLIDSAKNLVSPRNIALTPPNSNDFDEIQIPPGLLKNPSSEKPKIISDFLSEDKSEKV